MSDRSVDEALWEMILKYKQALTDRDYPKVAERESDRQSLWAFYDRLDSLRQKLLDTRAYLQLGRVQGAVNKTLLADDTDPSERLRMLARVVRMLTTPIVFLPGAGAISVGRFAPGGERLQSRELDQRRLAEDEGPPVRVRTRELAPAEMTKVQGNLFDQLADGLAEGELDDRLGFDEAELLSQMASRKSCALVWDDGRLRLEKLDPDVPDPRERIALVIKEGREAADPLAALRGRGEPDE